MIQDTDHTNGRVEPGQTTGGKEPDYAEYLQYTEHRERPAGSGSGADPSTNGQRSSSTKQSGAAVAGANRNRGNWWSKMPRNNRFLILAVVIALLVIGGYAIVRTGSAVVDNSSAIVPISQVVIDAQAGKIAKIVSHTGDSNISVWYGTGDSAIERTSVKEDNSTIQEMLIQGGVSRSKMPVISVEDRQSGSQAFSSIMVGLIFAFIMGLTLFVFIRERRGGSGVGMGNSFRKASARKFDNGRQELTFADVAGVEEAKGELAEVVEFLRNPNRFKALGARIPKGVLMVGPPGTGKTHLSRAVAGEAGVPFFSISGSEFVEMFVGVGASRIRDLFAQAKKQAPAIIFIDELDAVGRQRSSGTAPAAHEEREQTLMQLLVEMDGFDANTGIVVVGATNRPDILDQALLRPGRFDRQVVLDKPDLKGRVGILGVHAKGKPLAGGITLQTIAKMTPGFSGADLENLMNEAAILAARRHREDISMHELEEAVDRVVAGPARKSRVISDYEKAITAYHEVGHALTARMLPEVDPVHKISIVARGMAGGYTRVLPGEDRYLQSRSQFRDFLVFALGGRAAEEIIFDEVTTGASNDIERVTDIARGMVMKYGMSNRLGLISLGKRSGGTFLGSTSEEQVNYSDDVAREIDREVKEIVDEAYARAKHILTTYEDKLVEASELLIEKETLEADEFESLFAGIPRPEPKRKKLLSKGSLSLGPAPRTAAVPTVAATYIEQE